jgi:hypothetical protein
MGTVTVERSGDGEFHTDFCPDEVVTLPGYHIVDIPKGVLGMPSKINEEVAEFNDALEQSNPVMAIHELSDLYGAMESWLQTHHSSITMADLKTMSDTTKRAFINGRRT